jgi:hypothetical protein
MVSKDDNEKKATENEENSTGSGKSAVETFRNYYRRKKAAQKEAAEKEENPVTSAIPVTEAEPKETSPAGKKEHKSVIAMVPLLSLRSIIVMAIGLIVGVGLGLGYWIISPSLNASALPDTESEGELGGLAGIMGVSETHTGPYESSVTVQVVHPDSSYISLKDLQRMGEYYAAVANSLPFLTYISQELEEKAPEYVHTVSELDRIIVTRYDWDNELPSLEMEVTVETDQEALFLPTFVADTFKRYLVAEENEKQLQEYEDTLAEIEIVKAALSEAERELANLILEGAPYGTDDDPVVIALRAEIASLEFRLSQLTSQQAISIAGGSNIQDPVEIENISKALAEANRKLAVLEAEATTKYSTQNLDYKIAKAKVDTLNVELTDLTEKLSMSLGDNMEVPEIANYLVVGNSSTPSPILPERIRARNALIIGAIAGVVIALVILNFKWIAKGMPSSAPVRTKEDEEEA